MIKINHPFCRKKCERFARLHTVFDRLKVRTQEDKNGNEYT